MSPQVSNISLFSPDISHAKLDSRGFIFRLKLLFTIIMLYLCLMPLDLNSDASDLGMVSSRALQHAVPA